MTATETDSALAKALRVGLAASLVVLVLALYPYTVEPSGPIKRLVCQWAAFLLGGAWLIGTFLKRAPLERPRVFFELVAIFLAFNLVAGLFSSYVGNSLEEIRGYLALFVLYMVAAHVYRTPGQVRRLMLVVCVAVACSSVYALFQRAGYDPFPWADKSVIEYRDLPGTFGNPNYAAHTLVLAIVMAVYLATEWRMVWCLGFAALFVVHVFLAHQRGGVLGLAASAALCLIAAVVLRRVRRPAKAAGVTLGIFLVLGVAGIGGAMALNQARTGSLLPEDESLLLRYNSFYGAARMALAHPLLGYGPGNYEIENTPFWTEFEQRWFAERHLMNQHVHNDVLEVAIDAGLPAAGVYLTFLVTGIVFGLAMAASQDRARRRLGLAFAAFFCTFLVDGLFGFNLRVPVSAALLFVVAGAFEGLWRHGLERSPAAGPRDVKRDLALAWRVPVLALGLIIVVIESRAFAGEANYYRGKGYMLGQSYASAKAAFARGEQLLPWDWWFPYERGKACAADKDLAGAAEQFERSLRLNPNYLPAMATLAHTKLQMAVESSRQKPLAPEARERCSRLLDEASQNADRMVQLCPMLAEADEILGRAAWLRAELNPQDAQTSWQEVRQHFTMAIAHGAKNAARLYHISARASIALEDYDAAQDAFVHALDATPETPEVWQDFYRFAKEHGRSDALRDALRRSIAEMERRKDRNDDLLGSMYAWLAILQGMDYKQTEEAVVAYRAALRHAPTRADIWNDFAFLTKREGLKDAIRATVIETYDRMERESKPPLPAVEAVALVYKQGADGVPKAAEILVRVAESPGKLTAPVAVGWAAEIVLSEMEKAAASLQQHGDTLVNMGRVLMTTQSYNMAQQLFAAAMPSLAPDAKADCSRRRADALIQLKRYDEAIQELRQAMAQAPTDYELKLALARTLVKTGDTAAARTEYQRILESGHLTEEGLRVVQRELDDLRGH